MENRLNLKIARESIIYALLMERTNYECMICIMATYFIKAYYPIQMQRVRKCVTFWRLQSESGWPNEWRREFNRMRQENLKLVYDPWTYSGPRWAKVPQFKHFCCSDQNCISSGGYGYCGGPLWGTVESSQTFNCTDNSKDPNDWHLKFYPLENDPTTSVAICWHCGGYCAWRAIDALVIAPNDNWVSGHLEYCLDTFYDTEILTYSERSARYESAVQHKIQFREESPGTDHLLHWFIPGYVWEAFGNELLVDIIAHGGKVLWHYMDFTPREFVLGTLVHCIE